MSQFEFAFSLFGLLLGFSLVEVLGGLARAIEAHLRPVVEGKPRFRMGWLTPLLGVFVLLDLLSFWGSAWILRDVLTVSSSMLIGSLFFAGSYYLAAHLVFPQDLDTLGDMDVHFFRVRRIVMGALIALLALQLLFFASMPQTARLFDSLETVLRIGLLAALMIGAMLFRNRRVNAVILVALSVRYLVEAFV